MHDAELIVAMRLLEEGQVPLEAGVTLPALDFGLHAGDVGAELELFAVAEPDVVVRLALDELDVFSFEGGVEVGVAFEEEAR